MKIFLSKSNLSIAAIFSFRMFGLFMLLPVFSVYALDLKGATPLLIGLALGAYGLSQGLLQIPFGILSDKYGRKPIITFGLILFIIGSIIGAISDSIYLMLLARILQGTGAIGSTLIALMTDITPANARAKAMAVIGGAIGISFGLSMIISPIITEQYGLSGIFYLTTILAIIGLILLHTTIPTHKEILTPKTPFKEIIVNTELLKLNFSIFTQHLLFTSTFFAIPFLLKNFIETNHLTMQWHFYLPVLILSFIAILPFIIIGEKKKKVKETFLIAIILTLISQFMLSHSLNNWIFFIIYMFFYFMAFNLLEALIPSIISRVVTKDAKGSAMGVYSSSQFLGIFIGGLLAGIVYRFYGINGIFIVNYLFAIIWFLAVMQLKCNIYTKDTQ